MILNKDLQGNLKTALTIQAVSPLWIVSHDLADPCTWSQESIRVVDGTVTANEDNTLSLGHTNIIDLEHGRVYLEDDITGNAKYSIVPLNQSWKGGDHDLIPKLKVRSDLFERTDDEPGPGQWKVINYENGIIKIGEPCNVEDITVSFHYAAGSGFNFGPVPSKLFKFGLVEANWRNCDLESTILYFSIFSGVGLSNAERVRRIYKNEADYIAASIGAPIEYKDWKIMQWDYTRAQGATSDSRLAIKSSTNMFTRVKMVDDIPFQKLNTEGNKPKCVVTLYCTSESE